MKKEDLDSKKLSGNIAVVFDVLLATSTITAVLQEGANEVIPVFNWEEALEQSRAFSTDSIILAGEKEGETIEGFIAPYPSLLRNQVQGKTVFLSTTNGTVAIRKSQTAKKMYIASLLNCQAVSEMLVQKHQNETIVLICSGSRGQFCIEDFYGVGYMIHCLLEKLQADLTDSALAAHLFYKQYENDGYEILRNSKIGNMLVEYDFGHEITFVSKKSVYDIVPIWQDGKMVLKDSHLQR